MNQELAGIIKAALIFGDHAILSDDMEWIQYFSNSYRIPEEEAQEYLASYSEAANTHLNGSAQPIADSLKVPLESYIMMYRWQMKQQERL